MFLRRVVRFLTGTFLTLVLAVSASVVFAKQPESADRMVFRVCGIPAYAFLADSTKSVLLTDSLYWRSPTTAFNLSLFGTILPTASIIGSPLGLLAGPSFGYFYGGLPKRALTGIGVRLVAVGGMVGSFLICGWDCGPGDDAADVAWLVFVPSAGLLVVSTIYDIARVKYHVRQRNARLSSKAVMLKPRFYGESRTPGLEIVLRY